MDIDSTYLLMAAVSFVGAEAGKKAGGLVVEKAWEVVKSLFAGPAGQDSGQEVITPARVRERGLDRDPRLRNEVEAAIGRSSALRRARLVGSVLQGARALWVDDYPANNVHEQRALEALGVRFDVVTSTNEAVACAGRVSYDVILSDMVRTQPVSGLLLMRKLRDAGHATEVIFYVGKTKGSWGVPVGAFGIADRPNEMLHLVFDVLERRRV